MGKPYSIFDLVEDAFAKMIRKAKGDGLKGFQVLAAMSDTEKTLPRVEIACMEIDPLIESGQVLDAVTASVKAQISTHYREETRAQHGAAVRTMLSVWKCPTLVDQLEAVCSLDLVPRQWIPGTIARGVSADKKTNITEFNGGLRCVEKFLPVF